MKVNKKRIYSNCHKMYLPLSEDREHPNGCAVWGMPYDFIV